MCATSWRFLCCFVVSARQVICAGPIPSVNFVTQHILVAKDNCDDDCAAVIAHAMQQCAMQSATHMCEIELEAGATYPLRCPSNGSAAISIENISNLTFGPRNGVATLTVDYEQHACTAVAIIDASAVQLRNLDLDTQRTPFTVLTVRSNVMNGSAMTFTTPNQDDYLWDLDRYPWLSTIYDTSSLQKDGGAASYTRGVGLSGFTSWHRDVEPPHIVTLRWNDSSPVRAAYHVGATLFMKHFRNLPSHGIHGWNSTDVTMFNVTILTCAGMGFRCDFCSGVFSLSGGGVRVKHPRPMSTTADAFHVMHHGPGHVLVSDAIIEGQGDDTFNAHGNFIVLGDTLHGYSASYIAETGAGWITGAAEFMVGDRIRFYNRETLQALGDNTLIAAHNGTAQFQDPLPATLRRYDMFISLRRVTHVTLRRNMFRSAFAAQQSSAVLVSAFGAIIENNTFQNLQTPAIKLIAGGCGSWEYTEGPFSRDVLIARNRFENVVFSLKRNSMWAATLTVSGCTPYAKCGQSGVESYECSLPPRIRPDQSGGTGPGSISDHGTFLRQGQVFENITVESNTFVVDDSFQETWNSHIMHIGAVKGLSLRDNAIHSSSRLREKSSHDLCLYSSQDVQLERLSCFQEEVSALCRVSNSTCMSFVDLSAHSANWV